MRTESSSVAGIEFMRKGLAILSSLKTLMTRSSWRPKSISEAACSQRTFISPTTVAHNRSEKFLVDGIELI